MGKGFNTDEIIERFEKLTMDAGEVQRQILKKILEDNAETEYLSKWGLNGRTDPESFKACVPLVTNKDIEPYVERIMDGDDSPILTVKPATAIILSSGTTTGKRKYIPINDEMTENCLQMYSISFAYRDREFPVKNGKALQLYYGSKQTVSKGGLPIRTISSHVINRLQTRNPLLLQAIQSCSPPEVTFAPDFQQSLYCHLLSSLVFREQVQVVSSAFALNAVVAFRTFEKVWRDLCTDIRKGAVSSRITVPSVQTAMAKLLEPNPELADLLYEKCLGLEGKGWAGLIPELFPNTKYVHGIMTGSMLPYMRKLRHYAGEIPLVGVDYGASEGWVGANVNPRSPPESITYTVIPNIGYYEFIPLRKNVEAAEPEAVGLTDVKIGEEYEVVLTTPAGLYRNRLGDVVKVVGFRNSTPELQFVCRSNLLLQIHLDKNTEQDLQRVVDKVSELLTKEKLELVDFTSRADTLAEPPRYVIFWELNGEATDELLQECCDALDGGFVEEGYAGSRRANTLGPLELQIVREGTFQKVLDHYVRGGTSFGQFKTPRCVGPANEGMLQILSGNVAKSYFSTGYNPQ